MLHSLIHADNHCHNVCNYQFFLNDDTDNFHVTNKDCNLDTNNNPNNLQHTHYVANNKHDSNHYTDNIYKYDHLYINDSDNNYDISDGEYLTMTTTMTSTTTTIADNYNYDTNDSDYNYNGDINDGGCNYDIH